MPRIVTRAEWRARAPKQTPTRVSLSQRTATTVHWDGPNPVVVRSFEEACALMRRDQNYHMDSNGWSDIGYNFLVISAPNFPAIDGLIFEGRGRDVVGAHCADRNTPWIGIQVAIGKGQKPSAAALASVAWLHAQFEKAKGKPLARTGHKDGFNTECPGFDLYKWVHAGMPVPTTTPKPVAVSKPAPTEEDELMALTVKNPVSGEQWPVDDALWSTWTYAFAAARDSAASLAIVKAMAAKGAALTAAEIAEAAKAGAASALQERIESATIQLDVKEN